MKRGQVLLAVVAALAVGAVAWLAGGGNGGKDGTADGKAGGGGAGAPASHRWLAYSPARGKRRWSARKRDPRVVRVLAGEGEAAAAADRGLQPRAPRGRRPRGRRRRHQR